MAVKIKKINFDQEYLKTLLPLIGLIIFILFFLFVIFIPQVKKLISLKTAIIDKKNSFLIVERSSHDLEKLKKDLSSLENKSKELERKLPQQLETNLLIETLEAITEESKIKFQSIEPLNPVKFDLPQTQDEYLELPIKVKLKCGYYNLIDFVKEIENSQRLMKISDLSIKSNPQGEWEHEIEISISTFASSKR